MALNGLRMMPLFPRPSLKFRTVSFPQYGFKADLSDGAFLLRDLLKPTPGIHKSITSLHPPFVSFQTETCSPALSRAGILFRYRHSSLTALPQRSSLQSGLYCPRPSTLIDLIRVTHGNFWISQLCWLYQKPMLCGSAEASHEWFRAFTIKSLSACCPLRPRRTRQLHIPSSFTDDTAFISGKKIRHSQYSHHPLQMGADYVATGSLLLRPADLLASLTDLTRLTPCQQRLLLRSFRSGRSLFLPSDITTTATG